MVNRDVLNLTDHEIFRPQQLPRSQDLETVVHDAEAVGEATLGELVEGGRFRGRESGRRHGGVLLTSVDATAPTDGSRDQAMDAEPGSPTRG